MARLFTAASSEWIAFGNPSALNPSFPMTIAMIIRQSTAPGINAKILSRALTAGGRGWSFGVNNSDKLLFTKYGVADIPTVTNSLPNGRRALMGCVVTSTNVRFFLAAEPAYSIVFENVANAAAFAAGNPDNFNMGAEQILGGATRQRFWDGDVLVAAVWKVQATDAQVSGLLFGGLAAWYDIPSMVGLWQLEQAATTQAVVDETGNSAQSAINGTNLSPRAYPEWSAVEPQ